MIKKTMIVPLFAVIVLLFSCKPKDEKTTLFVKEDLQRSIDLLNQSFTDYFSGDSKMARFFNPYTDSISTETGSVWMYTASMEAVNAVLKGLNTAKANGDTEMYDKYFQHYVDLQLKLYNGLDYYEGTYTLTSYTQTKEWTVYGVHRSNTKGNAKVSGIENVYDDQMWLIREPR